MRPYLANNKICIRRIDFFVSRPKATPLSSGSNNHRFTRTLALRIRCAVTLNTLVMTARIREKLLFDYFSVFSLAVGSNTDKRKYSRLENYSRVSGGDIHYASKSRAMEQFYARTTEQARHEYTLAYVPAGTEPDSNYHRIELQVLGNGLTAQTREGYYKNRPAETPKE